jgi:nuclear receptor interaction protein
VSGEEEEDENEDNSEEEKNALSESEEENEDNESEDEDEDDDDDDDDDEIGDDDDNPWDLDGAAEAELDEDPRIRIPPSNLSVRRGRVTAWQCPHTCVAHVAGNPEVSVNYKRQWKGHLNVRTIKEVNFFGPDDQYILSGLLFSQLARVRHERTYLSPWALALACRKR